MIEKRQITSCLPVELKKKLQQEAEKRGYTVSDLVIFILHQYFENVGRE